MKIHANAPSARKRGPQRSRAGSSATAIDDDMTTSATGRQFSGYGSSRDNVTGIYS